MGAALRSTRTTPDTRALNVQPNHHPAQVQVIVSLDGEEIGPIGIPQGAKLSDKGNVTYSGGIKKGWELEGEPNATLRALSFTVDGVELHPGAAGVHLSQAGNPTVCQVGVVPLPIAGGEARRYFFQLYATYSVKKGAYSLKIQAWPAPSAVAGPAIAPGTTVEGAFRIAA